MTFERSFCSCTVVPGVYGQHRHPTARLTSCAVWNWSTRLFTASSSLAFAASSSVNHFGEVLAYSRRLCDSRSV